MLSESLDIVVGSVEILVARFVVFECFELISCSLCGSGHYSFLQWHCFQ